MPLLPEGLWKLIVSFLDSRMFAVDIRGHLSGLRQIRAGVRQRSVLGTSDLPNPVARGTLFATYADDSAFLATGSTPSSVSWRVPTFLNDFKCWAFRWNIALNVNKTLHATFAFRPGGSRGLYLDGDRL